MEHRVEELAARTGVSVDTVRFYQKEGLVPAPRREGRIAWYGAEHVARITRIKELQRRGFSLAVIKRFVEGDLDEADESLAVALSEGRDDGEDGDEEFLTLDELVARSGVPRALVTSVVNEGLLVARVHEGEPRYTPSDLDALRAGLALLEAGVPLPELFELARRHHELTLEVAEAAVGLFDEHVRTPLRESGLGADEQAERLVAAFRTALPNVTRLVSHHFARVLLAVAQEHLDSVGDTAEIEAARSEAQRRLEVVWSR